MDTGAVIADVHGVRPVLKEVLAQPEVRGPTATLGGGLGILSRSHGLTCDQLLAATLVRSDGRAIEADDELLWMLRGGDAPGVVTSLALRN
jgi:FAD/FMN-containing dehydrogenase